MNIIDDKDIFIVKGKVIKIATIKPGDEWYHNIDDPESFVRAVKRKGIKADIFTFRQNLPNTDLKYNKYFFEWESVAAIPVTSYDNWFNNQINKKTRQAIKKAKKKGVEIKVADFDDKLVKGIKKIYDESPLRQEKPFPHYGKNIDEVRRLNSSYLDSSDFLGAYYKNELIGFIKLTYMESYADPMQILAMMKHRDKATMNALIAKVVEICAERGIPYFLYGYWSERSFGAFKRHNGFEKFNIPRYFIPLTLKGKIVLSLRLHRDISEMIPEKVKNYLINLRRIFYEKKYGFPYLSKNKQTNKVQDIMNNE